MPDLTKMPVPLYSADQPYHWEYDNLPLKALADRDVAINNAVDSQSQILQDAAGNQSNVAVRLNQSLEDNGDLMASAVDQAMHNIAAHQDGSLNLSVSQIDVFQNDYGYVLSNPVPFVRMLEAERDKLALVANEATSFALEVYIPSPSNISLIPSSICVSNICLFDNTVVQLQPSDFITWEVQSPNVLKPILNLNTESFHRHYYDLEPITSDYIDFNVSNVSTQFVEGSLRVYINGIRLSSEYEVLYPPVLNPDSSSWSSNKYTPDHTTGTFQLYNPITSNDIIRIDFDVLLT